MDEKLTECLEKVKQKDPVAFTDLAEMYRPLILSMVESFLSSMPANSLGREDLVQEANFALYRAAIHYDHTKTEVTFGLYAKICVRNRLISALRKQRRLAKKPTKTAPPSPSPEEKYDWEKVRVQLSGVLTKYEEQVLSLRLSNYSYKEIATELHKDPKSIDNALCRIRKKVRDNRKDILPDGNE